MTIEQQISQAERAADASATTAGNWLVVLAFLLAAILVMIAIWIAEERKRSKAAHKLRRQILASIAAEKLRDDAWEREAQRRARTRVMNILDQERR